MIELLPMRKEDPRPCDYLPNQKACYQVMAATEVTPSELDYFLEQGWRRFGIFYYRPDCDQCNACVPIRIPLNHFRMSKSQARVMKKNLPTRIETGPLKFRPEIHRICDEHSRLRFGRPLKLRDTLEGFYPETEFSLQCEYFVNDELAAVGFIDCGMKSMNSVYFAFASQYSHLSLGTFGVLKEIELARQKNYSHYYLGYHIASNAHMRYKNRFRPYELLDKKNHCWNFIHPV